MKVRHFFTLNILTHFSENETILESFRIFDDTDSMSIKGSPLHIILINESETNITDVFHRKIENIFTFSTDTGG